MNASGFWIKEKISKFYKTDKDDSSILSCPKVPVFKAWKSLHIVAENLNYFGFGSQKNWFDQYDKPGEYYYHKMKSYNFFIDVNDIKDLPCV
jgi:hypothetical protein